jgi:hypothetical protein
LILFASARLGRKLTDGISDDIQGSIDGWGKISIDFFPSDGSFERSKEAGRNTIADRNGGVVGAGCRVLGLSMLEPSATDKSAIKLILARNAFEW